ncbi:MAG TPA: PAS domain S-box protein, partial [Spirochaetia bacterium]
SRPSRSDPWPKMRIRGVPLAHALSTVGAVACIVWCLDAGITAAGRFSDGHIIAQACIFITTLIISSLAVSVERQSATITSLGESERRSRSLVEHVNEGMLLTDLRGGVLSANSAACRMLGRTEEEISRVGTKGFVDVAGLEAAVEERRQTGAFRGELTLRRADGSVFPAMVSSEVFQGGGGEILASLVFRDLTEQKRAEGAERMASLGALVAGVRAELNNSNQVIVLSAEVLSRLWRNLVPVLEEYQDTAGEFSAAGMPFDELKHTVPACIEGLVTASRRIGVIASGLKESAEAEQTRPLAGHAPRRGEAS